MGTKERRGREKEKRRQEILDAARNSFWTKGFDGTTMPAIAAELELAPGTLYLYFPSKEALYLELLLEGYDILLARLKKAVDNAKPPATRIEKLLDAFLGFARETPEYFDIIFFVLQKEFGAVRKAGLDQSQIERLSLKEEACKKIVLEVVKASPKAQRTAEDALRLEVEAVWSMLAGVVFFWRSGTADEFKSVTAAAKSIIVKHLEAG